MTTSPALAAALAALAAFKADLPEGSAANFEAVVNDIEAAAKADIDNEITVYASNIKVFGIPVGSLVAGPITTAANKALDELDADIDASISAAVPGGPVATMLGTAKEQTRQARLAMSAAPAALAPGAPVRSIFTDIDNAISSLWTKLKAWAEAEEVVAQALGVEVLQAIEAVFATFGPTLLSELKTILAGLPADFLSGSTFEDILEEVLKTASADLQAAITAAGPQLVATIIGILLHAV